MTTLLENGYHQTKKEIEYADAYDVFAKISQKYEQHFLMESKQVSLFSGRFSLIGIDAIAKITGKINTFQITSLNQRGEEALKKISKKIQDISDSFIENKTSISGEIFRPSSVIEEHERSQQKNICSVIKIFLEEFRSEEKTLMGLYGAMGYDFVRLFEDLDQDFDQDGRTNDFQFMLFESFIFFDHIKESAHIIVQRENIEEAQIAIKEIEKNIESQLKEEPLSFKVEEQEFALSEHEYVEMVKKAQVMIREGDLFQIVLSNRLEGRFKGNPLALYKAYRDHNPSPYLFYYDFGGEQLVGASPEMMIRYEEGRVHLRPIAGTIHRGEDAIQDHDQMLALLNNPKERAELDMLIDLGRNDLSRICKPGIEIDDYRFVEKYSRVMHTVAHLSGELKNGFTGLDALVSCLNAGTLTGAPKVQAMRTIDELEGKSRGYYGGCLGQFSFSGEVDTTILIRTAHLEDGHLRYQSGAGIVYDSDPQKEYQETIHKAQAFLDVIQNHV